jgi:hypothetical protein
MPSSDSLPPQRFKNHSVKPLATAQPVPPTFRRDTFDPEIAPRKRKGISPGLIVLFGLMGLFGLYATGNLPEADILWGNATQSLQTNNDSLVNSILKAGPTILLVVLGLFVAFCIFLMRNAARRRQAEESQERPKPSRATK